MRLLARDLQAFFHPVRASIPPAFFRWSDRRQRPAKTERRMSKRILLVEDDASVLEGARRLLSAAGYEVETARNGLEALESVNRQKPDAIILDLIMPVMTGWEFLSIRQRHGTLDRIPVIVWSGDEVRMPGLIGFGISVRKPVSPERLLGTLERLLALPTGPATATQPIQETERDFSSEPWSVDSVDLATIRNSRGQPVAVAFSEREARRIAAAVNGVREISTESLEGGIVEKGLECLFRIYRYRCDEPYRGEIDQSSGFEGVLARGDSLWNALKGLLRPSEDAGSS
jgi:two-component system, response regulator, stage 0 sporulation protein F